MSYLNVVCEQALLFGVSCEYLSGGAAICDLRFVIPILGSAVNITEKLY